MKKDPK